MNRNVMLLTQFSQVYLLTNSIVTTNSGMPSSRISFTWKYMLCRGDGFSFFGHGKVMEKSRKINVEKEGAPCCKGTQTNGKIILRIRLKMKKRSEATQTLRAGCSKADPQTNTQQTGAITITAQLSPQCKNSTVITVLRYGDGPQEKGCGGPQSDGTTHRERTSARPKKLDESFFFIDVRCQCI